MDFIGKENKISRKMYFSSYSPVPTVWPGYKQSFYTKVFKTDFLYDKVKSDIQIAFEMALKWKQK